MSRKRIAWLTAWTVLVVATTALTTRAFVSNQKSAGVVPRLERDDASDPATPLLTPSTLLRQLDQRSGDQEAPEGCSAVTFDYGTDADIQEVVNVFEGIGFVGRGAYLNDEGEIAPNGQLIRWIGERPRQSDAWRAVDIAIGDVAGRPGWPTAIEMFSAVECINPPGITPAPPLP